MPSESGYLKLGPIFLNTTIEMSMPKWVQRLSEKFAEHDTTERTDGDTEHLLYDSAGKDDSRLISESGKSHYGSRFAKIAINLLIVLIALALMIVFLLYEVYMEDSKCYGAFEKGFDTDLRMYPSPRFLLFLISLPSPRASHTDTTPGAAKSHIELEKVLFTGGIHFNPDGSVYIKGTPGPTYVGKPSPEIDEAWDKLLYG